MSKVYKYISRRESELPAREELGLSSGDRIVKETFRDLMLVRGLTKNMNSILGSLIVEERLWDVALELARSREPQVAFRSSWALEWAYTVESGEIERRFGIFFNDFLSSENESVQRVYSKMLCDMLRRGAVTLSDEEAVSVAERSFALLTCADTPVAVLVWQIELLYDLVPRLDWIEENLTAVVRRMSESPDCPPSIAASARRYLRRIKAVSDRKRRNAAKG